MTDEDRKVLQDYLAWYERGRQFNGADLLPPDPADLSAALARAILTLDRYGVLSGRPIEPLPEDHA